MVDLCQLFGPRMRCGLRLNSNWLRGLAAGVSALLASSCADAPGTPSTDVQLPIHGGSAVPAGAWPSLAWLENGCSGVLLAPDLLVFAAHCGLGASSAWFGDQLDITIDDAAGVAPAASGPGVTQVGLGQCAAYPDWQIGTDIAYCVLDRPVIDASAIAPALPASARSRVLPGTPVSLVGFGRNSPSAPAGNKLRVDVPIRRVGQELEIGDSEFGTCTGDSGSPALIALGDASHPDWHVAGVLSSGNSGDGCGVGYYSDISTLTSWLEGSSGRGLSPGSEGWPAASRCAQASLDADGVPMSGAQVPSPNCPAHLAESSGCSSSPGNPTGSGVSTEVAPLGVALLLRLRRRRSRR